MKQFKYGNHPTFIVRDPIRKTRQTDFSQAEKVISTDAFKRKSMKTSSENIKTNFGFIDVSEPSVDTKISNSSNEIISAAVSYEAKTAGYQTKQTKEIEEKINFSSDPSLHTKKAVSDSRKRRVTTRITSQQSVVNGLGGWKL